MDNFVKKKVLGIIPFTKCTDLEGWGPWSDMREPDFTLCFEQSLITIPNLLLIIIGLPKLYHLIKYQQFGLHSPNLHFFVKALLSIMLIISGIFIFTLEGKELIEGRLIDIAVLSSFTQVLAMLVVSLLSLFTHKSQLYSSTILLVYWPIYIVLQVIEYRTMLLSDKHIFQSTEFWAYVSHLGVSIIMFGVECYPKKYESEYIGYDNDYETSPEERANIYSFLTFSWMSDLLALGYSKPLVAEDLWVLPKEYQVDNVSKIFQSIWTSQVKTKTEPSLTASLVYAFSGPFLLAALFKGIQDVLGFVQPTLLSYLINFIDDYQDEAKGQPIYYGFGIAFAMFFTAIVQTSFLHQYFQLCMVTGMKIRTALVTAIYQKALKISSSTSQTSSVGEIVNHMSVDAQRLQDLCNYVHVAWSGIFQIVIALTLLYKTVGPSVFAGLAVMIVAIPVNGYITSKMRKLQQELLKIKDSRIKHMDELLSGIKVIKLYAWEKSFLGKLFHIRNDQELATLRKTVYLNCATTFTGFSLPQFVSLTTFAVYAVVSDKPLTTDTVFVSLALLNLLAFPLNMLPYVISATVEAMVSVKRIHKFLTSEEIDPKAVTKLPRSDDPKLPAVEVKNGTFQWSNLSSTPTLSDINIKIKRGSLFSIIGRVGSGKSSLVSSILGDMHKLEGDVTVRGKVAFVPQQPWIMNATVRENIVFGHRFNSDFYEETIRVCALKQDLDMLVSGDMTEIGERGINLSGGQKARISLARAVYSRADVYLLDDPLSAVDAHVGKHIFDNVLGPEGILRSKTRVLVTHAVNFFPQMDHLVLLHRGEIQESGTYQQLYDDSKSEIHNFIAAMSQEAKQTEEAVEDSLSQLGQSYASQSQLGKSLGNQSVKSQASVVDENTPIFRTTSHASYQSLRPASVASIRRRNKRSSNSNDDKVDRLITVEESAQGSVSSSVYSAYFKACSYPNVLLYLGLAVFVQAGTLGGMVWLKTMTGKKAVNDPLYNLSIYGAISIGTAVITFIQYVVLYILCGLRAARTTHNSMLMSVVRAPMSFFDTTPLGRIVNRFSKDQSTLDETLPRSFGGYIGTLMKVVFVLGVISFTTPAFIGLGLILGVIYVYIQRYYLQTSRELKRLDSVSRSPIFAHFQETVGGVTTIRAYQQQYRFRTENEDRLDTNLKAYYPSVSLNRWLAVRLEFLGAIIIFSSAVFAVLTLYWGLPINNGQVGLSVTYALNVTQSLNWCIRMYCEIETNIVSMERIKEYIELAPEAPYDSTLALTNSDDSTNILLDRPEDLGKALPAPAMWPSSGAIEFKNYSTRYRAGLDLVLNNISLQIEPKEKVGIVGRTGAGKSSLTLALFRIIESASGSILIDGIDISKLALHDLRSQISIIPQDPVLFAGTVRNNLDPFHTSPDADLWRALEHANLRDHISTMEGGLDANVAQGGENFSVGQRQLICLARALLRKSSVLVLDEATAAIDYQTDNLIQQTIRDAFKHCTVLTIAHRINTVMDGDKILVLDKGKVAEFESPTALLKKKKSIFYGLAKEAGLVN